MNELFIERDGFLRVALTRAGQLEELKVIRDSSRPVEGDIYHGVIRNVSVSQKAVFIDIGSGRNAYLYVRDRRNIGDYREGEGITVEILRSESGKKGAKVTDELSISDGNLVILAGKGFSFSSNLNKERFLAVHSSLPRIPGVHVMYRSGSLRLSTEELVQKAQSLAEEFRQILTESGQLQAPGRVFRDRYLLNAMVDQGLAEDEILLVHCNDQEAAAQIRTSYPGVTVQEYPASAHLFFRHGLESVIDGLRSSRVPLPAGGSLIIEETEALTAMDVNSGSTGARGKVMDSYGINREALRSAFRQIALRNLAGIIVIDFIEMKKERDQQKLFEEARDLAKHMTPLTRVYPLTELGLMQIARRRQGESLRKTLFSSDPGRRLAVSASYLYKLIRIRLDDSGWAMNSYEITTNPVYAMQMQAIAALLLQDYPDHSFRFQQSVEVDVVTVLPFIKADS